MPVESIQLTKLGGSKKELMCQWKLRFVSVWTTLQDGEPVEYRTAQQGVLQKGVIFIKPGLDAQAGILCECCNQVVSCSKFEAHAGQGSRRYVHLGT